MDTLSLTVLEYARITSPIYLGFVAAFIIGLFLGVYLGGRWVEVRSE